MYKSICVGNLLVAFCRSAMQKATPKKPIDYCMFSACPVCENVEINDCNYCPDCGQRLDWSDFDLSGGEADGSRG